MIRHLHRSEGLSQRAIARQLGIARDTVAGALASDNPPKYERAAASSAISEVEPRMRALLTAIGQLVEVSTTLSRVTVSRAGHLLAAHDRCWAARQTLTDPAHAAMVPPLAGRRCLRLTRSKGSICRSAPS